MTKWKMRDNAKCPRCDVDESTQHVVQCQAPENLEQFKESMEPLKTWLTETTSPRIASAVRTHMNAYQKTRRVNGFKSRDERVKHVSKQQDKLGIRSFGEGFLAKEWREVQARHYGGEDAASKSRRWTAKLIQKIWEVSWDMWQSRNYLIHYNNEVRDELFVERMNVDLEVLWSEGRDSKLLYHPERQFFTITLEELLKKDEYNKVRWIEIAERYLDPNRIAAREASSQGVLMRWLRTTTQEQGEDRNNLSPLPTRQYVDLGTPVRLTQQRILWNPQQRNTPSPTLLRVGTRKRTRHSSESTPAGLRSKQQRFNESTPSGLTSAQQCSRKSMPTSASTSQQQVHHHPPSTGSDPVANQTAMGKRKRSQSTSMESGPKRQLFQQSTPGDEYKNQARASRSQLNNVSSRKRPISPSNDTAQIEKRQRLSIDHSEPIATLRTLPAGASSSTAKKRKFQQQTLPWAPNKRHQS